MSCANEICYSSVVAPAQRPDELIGLHSLGDHHNHRRAQEALEMQRAACAAVAGNE
jgi:hypothetical protein